ncbi:F-box/kelch-repeat protein At3g06240-like [Papaver somniferum]|uniref:F-box/kelch-repeat protein At3g06240-like n=1 Tax=Papaver somniferum TaxID=3469 RepID=UPI000E700A13|nr:F-box/kelch-repeat protein At3g06240-like [Papaver somniferum]
MVSQRYLIHAISHDSLTSFDTSEYDDDAVEMDYPFKSSDIAVKLVCSCNGLVLLWYDDYPDSKEFFCLWNPATHEYKVIHESPNEFLMEDGGMQAFKYDYKIDDYKLVKVVHQHGDKFPFNLASDVLVNGALHWVLAKWVIVSLNISDERFEVIQLPNEPLESKHLFTNVGVLEGCLCVLASVPEICYNVWVMQEYGIRESWTKRYVITHDRILKHDCFLSLLWSFKNGEILFFIPGNLILYNPMHASIREPNIFIQTHLYATRNYFESLVPLNSGTYVQRLEEEEEE